MNIRSIVLLFTLTLDIVKLISSIRLRRADRLQLTPDWTADADLMCDSLQTWVNVGFLITLSAENPFTWRLKYRYNGCAVFLFLPANQA